MNTADVGAVAFGLVIGWVTYRTLIRRAGSASLSDIATVVGAVGGAAVTGLFDDKGLFGLYSIGLAAGFISYFAVFLGLNGKQTTSEVMGGADVVPGRDV